MRSWHFYPLAQYPRTGVLIHEAVDGKRTPFPAEFLTQEAAKARRPKQLTRDAT